MFEREIDEYYKLLEEYKKELEQESGCKVANGDYWGDGGMVTFAQYCVKRLALLDVSKPVICPNCEEECNPISLGAMCDKCYYDKL